MINNKTKMTKKNNNQDKKFFFSFLGQQRKMQQLWKSDLQAYGSDGKNRVWI